jgi:hypothetical protein
MQGTEIECRRNSLSHTEFGSFVEARQERTETFGADMKILIFVAAGFGFFSLWEN